jgi:hypothetical protein
MQPNRRPFSFIVRSLLISAFAVSAVVLNLEPVRAGLTSLAVVAAADISSASETATAEGTDAGSVAAAVNGSLSIYRWNLRREFAAD